MDENIAVRNISDKEIWNGENKIKLIEGNIIHIVARGPQSTQSAIVQKVINEQLSKLVNGKVSYLIDLNNAGKSSPEARRLWKETSETVETTKVALFGVHPVARVIASFVMSITFGQNVRFFTTMEEGLIWIKK